jgi:hypothetical protein
MSKETLLEKARQVQRGRQYRVYTTEDIELSLAWTRGEVSLKQVTSAWGLNGKNPSYVRLALALRQHFSKKGA